MINTSLKPNMTIDFDVDGFSGTGVIDMIVPLSETSDNWAKKMVPSVHTHCLVFLMDLEFDKSIRMSHKERYSGILTGNQYPESVRIEHPTKNGYYAKRIIVPVALADYPSIEDEESVPE